MSHNYHFLPSNFPHLLVPFADDFRFPVFVQLLRSSLMCTIAYFRTAYPTHFFRTIPWIIYDSSSWGAPILRTTIAQVSTTIINEDGVEQRGALGLKLMSSELSYWKCLLRRVSFNEKVEEFRIRLFLLRSLSLQRTFCHRSCCQAAVHLPLSLCAYS